MKLITVSTALRIALLWLLDHVKPAEQPSEQELIAFGCEQERNKPIAFIPVVYEPPEPRTGPIMQPPHGRYFLQERKRFGVISLEPTEPLAPPPKDVFPVWLNDLPKDIAPSALDQLSQLVETEVKLKAVRERHEGRGKAS